MASDRKSEEVKDTKQMHEAKGSKAKEASKESQSQSQSESQSESESKGSSKGSPKESKKESKESGTQELSLAKENVFSYARHGKFEDVEEMLAHGLVPDSRDPNGNTILIIAAQNNYKGIVKLALMHGADINAANHTGNTALHYCSEYGYLELGNYLLTKCASPRALNMYGLMAFQGLKQDRHRAYPHLRYLQVEASRKVSHRTAFIAQP